MFTNTFCTQVPNPDPNSALKSPPMIGMHFLSFCMCFSMVFVHLFDLVVRVFRVWEVHTHQFNTTAVDYDRCFDGALADVICVEMIQEQEGKTS